MEKNEKKVRHKVSTKVINNKKYVSRLTILLILFAVVIGFLGYFRVFMIKKDRDKYETTAINQQINKVQDKVIVANRGDIVDRNGETLAVGETVFDIIIDPKLLVEVDAGERKRDSEKKAAAARSGKEYKSPEFQKMLLLHFLKPNWV